MANANSAIINQRFSPYNVKQGQARKRQAQDLSADGAITVIDGVVTLSKTASAGAYTIAAPTQNNSTGVLIITSTTARAHVITCALGFNGKGSSGTATFGGAIGDSLMIFSDNGIWYTAGSPRNVTLA